MRSGQSSSLTLHHFPCDTGDLAEDFMQWRQRCCSWQALVLHGTRSLWSTTGRPDPQEGTFMGCWMCLKGGNRWNSELLIANPEPWVAPPSGSLGNSAATVCCRGAGARNTSGQAAPVPRDLPIVTLGWLPPPQHWLSYQPRFKLSRAQRKGSVTGGRWDHHMCIHTCEHTWGPESGIAVAPHTYILSHTNTCTLTHKHTHTNSHIRTLTCRHTLTSNHIHSHIDILFTYSHIYHVVTYTWSLK